MKYLINCDFTNHFKLWITFLCILSQLNKCLCIIFYNEDDSQTLILIPNQTEPISIISSNKKVEFSLISVHSQLKNITLSYDDPTKLKYIRRDRKLTGLNVGLLVNFDKSYPKRNYLYVKNENQINLRVYIRVLQYDGFHPIPGGCNLEFPIQISPFLQLKTNELNLVLEYQKASLGTNFRIIKDKQDCDFSNSRFNYDVYSLYLKENDFSEHEYINGLRRMSSVDSIETYGTKLNIESVYKPTTRIKILAYRGKGVVFNVIVSFLNYKTAYSPVVSYDCDLNNRDNCRSYTNWIEIIYFLLYGLTGLLICLDASKNSTFQLAYFSCLTGSIITYIIASKYVLFKSFDNIYITIFIGTLFINLICFLIWFKWSSKCLQLTLILSGIDFGFLLISLALSINIFGIYHINHSLFHAILIGFGLLIIPICSIFINNNKLNAFCCLIIGSYMFIISIEQFFNGSLIYIVKNPINTIIYTDLYLMEINLPFQNVDYISSSIWFILISLSIFLNLIIDFNFLFTSTLLNSLRSFSIKLIQQLNSFRKKENKKYEEIETIDNRDEEILKYNELSRSILGSINNLDKDEICSTSFNSNSKYSSPIIKRRTNANSSLIKNSSQIKIDLPLSPSTSRSNTPKFSSKCSTPKLNQRDRVDHLDYLSQSIGTPNLLKNVVITNARYSSTPNRK